MKLALLTILTTLSLLSTVSAVSAVEETYAECVDTGYVPPCLDNLGGITYSCDDERYEKQFAENGEAGCILTDEQVQEDPFLRSINPSDDELWDFYAAQQGEGFYDGKPVHILVYVDVGGAYGDTQFEDNNARVCIETKGGQYGDAAECQDEVYTGGNITSHVLFGFGTTPTDEGVYLPEGRDFFACVQISTPENEHIHNCAEGKNTGDNTIAVHVPFGE